MCKFMSLIRLIILSLFIFTQAQADTIYNIIKIPHLEIYDIKTPNKLRYLYAKQPFTIGVDNNSDLGSGTYSVLGSQFAANTTITGTPGNNITINNATTAKLLEGEKITAKATKDMTIIAKGQFELKYGFMVAASFADANFGALTNNLKKTQLSTQRVL